MTGVPAITHNAVADYQALTAYATNHNNINSDPDAKTFANAVKSELGTDEQSNEKLAASYEKGSSGLDAGYNTMASAEKQMMKDTASYEGGQKNVDWQPPISDYNFGEAETQTL
jgi:hypothetical protein